MQSTPLTVMEGTCASLIAFSFNSECMASISDVGLNLRPATEVVRFRMAFSGLNMKREEGVLLHDFTSGMFGIHWHVWDTALDKTLTLQASA